MHGDIAEYGFESISVDVGGELAATASIAVGLEPVSVFAHANARKVGQQQPQTAIVQVSISDLQRLVVQQRLGEFSRDQPAALDFAQCVFRAHGQGVSLPTSILSGSPRKPSSGRVPKLMA